jgi:hypothetical protein
MAEPASRCRARHSTTAQRAARNRRFLALIDVRGRRERSGAACWTGQRPKPDDPRGDPAKAPSVRTQSARGQRRAQRQRGYGTPPRARSRHGPRRPTAPTGRGQEPDRDSLLRPAETPSRETAVVPPDVRFAAIYANPPTRIGRKARIGDSNGRKARLSRHRGSPPPVGIEPTLVQARRASPGPRMTLSSGATPERVREYGGT